MEKCPEMHRKNTMEQSSGTAFEYARKEIVILKLPHTFKGVSVTHISNEGLLNWLFG